MTRLEDLEKTTLEYAKKGITYCASWYVDQELAADEVERRLDANEDIEEFVPNMMKEEWDMTVFEEED